MVLFEKFNTPIAAQCPEEGGPGVFVSRSILNQLGVKSGFDDELNCYPPERITNNNYVHEERDFSKIHIYPNPSSGIFYLSSSLIDFSQTNLRLTDLSGRENWYIQKI
jgi:hypothetical protein